MDVPVSLVIASKNSKAKLKFWITQETMRAFF